MATKKQKRNRLIALGIVVGLFLLVGLSLSSQQGTTEKYFSEELGTVVIESQECGTLCQAFNTLFSFVEGPDDAKVGQFSTADIVHSCPRPESALFDTTVSSVMTVTLKSPSDQTVFSDTFTQSNMYIGSNDDWSSQFTTEMKFKPKEAGFYTWDVTWSCYAQPIAPSGPVSTTSLYEQRFSGGGGFNVEDVECTSDSECGTRETSFVCDNGDVYESTTEPVCESDFMCSTDVSQSLEETCQYGCSNGQCESEPKETFYRLDSCQSVEKKPSQTDEKDFSSKSECEANQAPTTQTYWKIVDKQCVSEDLDQESAPTGYYDSQSACESDLPERQDFFRYDSSENNCKSVFIYPEDQQSNDYESVEECKAQIETDDGEDTSGTGETTLSDMSCQEQLEEAQTRNYDQQCTLAIEELVCPKDGNTYEVANGCYADFLKSEADWTESTTVSGGGTDDGSQDDGGDFSGGGGGTTDSNNIFVYSQEENSCSVQEANGEVSLSDENAYDTLEQCRNQVEGDGTDGGTVGGLTTIQIVGIIAGLVILVVLIIVFNRRNK